MNGTNGVAQQQTRSWSVPASKAAMRTTNPIRGIVDYLKIEPNPTKEMVSLSIGDPTVFGNFAVPENAIETLIKNLRAGTCNGYPHSSGYNATREAVAKKLTTPKSPLTAQDIVITSGCSQALDLSINVLADPGKNVLLPCPGFPLYQTICENKGIDFKHYNLLPNKDWEVDLIHLESLIDENTCAVVINNPSNPCGSVYSQAHLLDILALSEKYRIPIIADEIYGHMVFTGFKFHPLGELSVNTPILSVGGIAKQYSVPGWRLGWIVLHDRNGVLKQVREGLSRLSQLTLGASSIPQSVVPSLLTDTPQSYYEGINNKLETHANYCYERMKTIPGLSAVVPQGAMYMMVGIDLNKFKDVKDDMDFTQKLLCEESVFVLPGKCFRQPNFFRIVICPPVEKLKIAFDRLEAFCKNHIV